MKTRKVKNLVEIQNLRFQISKKNIRNIPFSNIPLFTSVGFTIIGEQTSDAVLATNWNEYVKMMDLENKIKIASHGSWYKCLTGQERVQFDLEVHRVKKYVSDKMCGWASSPMMKSRWEKEDKIYDKDMNKERLRKLFVGINSGTLTKREIMKIWEETRTERMMESVHKI